LPKLSRILVALSGLLLLTLYALPLWRIELVAPQYPEGLGMRIHIDSIAGLKPNDLQNINGLNHYIGMKEIRPDSIPELRIMPWIVGGLAASALLVAAAGRRRLLYAWVGLFGLLGVAGLVDFWLWEYDYGHNLDQERAIIKIPGMSYQPPLIGSKQLLNFVARSWPDWGGIAAGVSFGLALVAVVLAVRAARRARAGAAEPVAAPRAAAARQVLA
jgi:hypothetical protein